MKENGKRRWSAVLLALALCFSLVTPVMAEEEAPQGPAVIKLTRNETWTQTKEITKDTILDLAGHTLTFNLKDESAESTHLYGIEVAEGKTLTIRDSRGSGKLTIQNGDSQGKNKNVTAVFTNNGNVIVESGTIESISNLGTCDAYGIEAFGDFSVTVTGGEITATQTQKECARGARAISTAGIKGETTTGTIDISGGKITATSAAENYSAQGNNYATAVWANNYDTDSEINVTISGGTITAETAAPNAYTVWNKSGASDKNTFAITGGTIIAKVNNSFTDGRAIAFQVDKGKQNTIFGGEIQGKFNSINNGGITLKGGKFSESEPAFSVVAAGYQAETITGDTLYKSKVVVASDPVASVTKPREGEGVGYATVQDAFNAAASGDTVKLLKDQTELTASVTAKASVTLNLNGKKLSFADTVEKGIIAEADLTVMDSGSKGEILVSYEGFEIQPYAIYGEGDITVRGGSITASTTKSTACGLYTSGNIFVYGGKISATATDEGGRATGLYAIGDVTVYGDAVIQANGCYDSTAVQSREGSITIREGSIRANDSGEYGDAFGVYGGSQITVTGGTIDVSAADKEYDYAYGVCASDYTAITIEDGAFITVKASGESSKAYGVIGGEYGTPVTVTGGEIVVTSLQGKAYGIEHDGSPEDKTAPPPVVRISGGTITATGTKEANGVECWSEECVTDISGGKLIANTTNNNSAAYGVYGCGPVNVSGGTINANILDGKKDSSAYGVDCWNVVNVSGGAINAEGGDQGTACGVRARMWDDEDNPYPEMAITGGTIKATIPEGSAGSVAAVCAGTTPRGGVFGMFDLTISGTAKLSAQASCKQDTLGQAVIGAISSDKLTVKDDASIQVTGDGAPYMTLGAAAIRMDVQGGVIQAVSSSETGNVFAVLSSGNADQEDDEQAPNSITIKDGILLAKGGAEESRHAVGNIGMGEATTTITGGWFTQDPREMLVLDKDEVGHQDQAEAEALDKALEDYEEAYETWQAARDALDEALNPSGEGGLQLSDAPSIEDLKKAEEEANNALIQAGAELEAAIGATMIENLPFVTADGVASGCTVNQPEPPAGSDYSDAVYHVVRTDKPSGGGGGSTVPTNDVMIAGDIAGGTVTTARNHVGEGTQIIITATPDEGNTVGSVTVTDQDGKAVAVTDNGDGTYSFIMPNSPVTIDATFLKNGQPVPHSSSSYDKCDKGPACPLTKFRDLTPTAWYHDGIHWALDENVMQGVSQSEFQPNGATTRAMIVTMLWRMEGEPPAVSAGFTDVTPGSWYEPAVNWAAAGQLVAGYGDNTFGPSDPVTREQLVTILYRFAQFKGLELNVDENILDYDDALDISSWAVEPFRWAVQEGVISGVGDNKLSPKTNASRSQVATMLMRFSDLL